jgi:hypothetical protein
VAWLILKNPTNYVHNREKSQDKKQQFHHFLRGFAVFADSLNALAVGAPGEPGFLIFSPLPALIRSRLA